MMRAGTCEVQNLKNVLRVVKNVGAFFVTVIVGLVVGAALFTVEAVETVETDAKKRIERHRTPPGH
jgi:hypothetical protein